MYKRHGFDERSDGDDDESRAVLASRDEQREIDVGHEEEDDRASGIVFWYLSAVRWLRRYFEFDKRHASMFGELRGGFVTFLSMSYILFVNPRILSESGMPSESVATATAVTACIGTMWVGVFGNLPFGLAAGMGLNTYFANLVIQKDGASYELILVTVLFESVIFSVLSIVGVNTWIQNRMPQCIRIGITVGIGMLLTFEGLASSKIIVPDPDTILHLGDLLETETLLAIAGFAVMVILVQLHFKGSILVGIVLITGLSWAVGESPVPSSWIGLPSLTGTLFAFNFKAIADEWRIVLEATVSFTLVCIFDTAGVQFALGTSAGLSREDGSLPGSKSAFLASGVASLVGACIGTSPVIIHNETAAGIIDGARTGVSSIFVALFFAMSIVFAPIFVSIPQCAISPILIVVGVMMMQVVRFMNWANWIDATSAFLAIVLMAFTASIANGIIASMVAYVVLWLVDATQAAIRDECVKRGWCSTPEPDIEVVH